MEQLKSVAVLGAGGKMGSGIAWVALRAMAEADARAHGIPGSGEYALTLIDADSAAFRRLREYLRGQLVKAAEKGINDLRLWAKDRADLIENREIIDAYVEGAMGMIRFASGASEAKGARLVFEAIFEDLGIKRAVYSHLKSVCGPDTVFLTNTSSIPIGLLDESAGLDGRILGFHFYNPPAVQKLVEMISGKRTRPEVVALGRELGKAFGKTVVPSNDVAGFIGNGHFIRELLFAMSKYRELRREWSEPEAWYLLDKVTREFLVRPMGLAQLMDYVGLDVFKMITRVMREYLADPAFADETLDRLLAEGIRGGQLGSGEQKDGVLRYQKNKPAAVLANAALPEGNRYVSLAEPGRFAKADTWLGAPPEGHALWSAMSKDPARATKLETYLAALAQAEGNGARLAREFLTHSRAVGQGLVRDGVAATPEDVGSVLKHGFFHLYAPSDWNG